MRFRNSDTGDVLEVPPPDELGASVVLFNGEVVELVLYSDKDGGSMTLGNGKRFSSGREFAAYIVEQLRVGAYERPRPAAPETRP